MLGDSTVLGTGGGSSGGDAVSTPTPTATVPALAPALQPAVAVSTDAASPDATGIGGEAGRGGSISGDDEKGRGGDDGERSFGGNRWPRQETLALLKIRSDMDVAFRDASVKGPLWEEVSRKLAELGYHRNAKKCKEKFENVYKYHKRTKEGRTGKSDGKTYRFFDQLEALEHNPAAASYQSPKTALSATPVSIVKTTASLPPPQQQAPITTVPMLHQQQQQVSTAGVPPHGTTTTTLPISMPQTQTNVLNIPTTITIPSSYSQQQTNPTYNFPPPPQPPTTNPITTPSFPSIPAELLSNSTSSSTSSDETIEGRRKRKRKWKDFFERLMKEVVEKQEELQRRFLEAIEKREQERVAREEAWRVQELQRINREREILAQERSFAAAKDQAVMSFLQKIAEQQNLGTALNNINIIPQTTSAPAPAPPATTTTPPIVQLKQQSQLVTTTEPASVVSLAKQQTLDMQQQQQQQQVITSMEIVKADNNNNNGENLMSPSSSRWPKAEVQALINLRTSLDTKYQENGPKGPLWEEISSLMRKIGYNRSAKRCKEKWENINKYFKKVKESNKKRPEDSKTCPYFHQLDALYREKNKHDSALKLNETITSAAPLMVQPEQQWPPQHAVLTLPSGNTDNDHHSLPTDQHQHQEHEEEEDENEDEGRDMGDEDDDEDDDDDDEGGDNYEIVPSKPASSVGASAE